ncbi:MAG TPA: carboxypeptidase-like regulatory domain-containing protein [Terracidiphilus sp.]|jgi:hypothetical protein|nr:carboxypeptidase-like regulatory domain-containing protein [Terracidiphilus sp.]
MSRRFTLRFALSLALTGALFTAAALHGQDKTRWTRKYKTPPQSSRIQILVVKADNGKPIENAAVIFHPIEGDRDKGALELKTDEDGKAIIDVIPIGDTVRLQIIANGFQTYGGDYKVDKDAMSMEIHLKRPVRQYSIYKNNGPTADNSSKPDDKPENNPDSGKSADSKGSDASKNAAAPNSGDKSSDSGNAGSQPDSGPSEAKSN